MSKLEEMLGDYKIPPVCKIRQEFDRTVLAEPEDQIRQRWQEKGIKIQPGERIAITAGSRGIACYQQIMRTIVELVKEAGGIPFIVPAMGSHGGGTAKGQEQILANLGITKQTTGAPIVSCMDVVEVARTELGLPVYIDKHAYEADGIILLNRVKSHTSIREAYQSGLLKMMAIGLAKHKGAAMTHSLGTPNLGANMVRVGKAALKRLDIRAGIAVIENGYEQLADAFVLRKDEILEQEPLILKRALQMLPRILVDDIDCLIVYEQGKNISGTGMDPAVIGRPINRKPNDGPNVETLGVLNLTAQSDGNASGCGMADFISRKLRLAVNEEYTCVNSLTGMHPEIAAIPVTLETDKLVFQGCIKASGQIHTDAVKLVIIRNTNALEEIYVSEAALQSIREKSRIKVCSEFMEVPFDEEGNQTLFQNSVASRINSLAALLR